MKLLLIKIFFLFCLTSSCRVFGLTKIMKDFSSYEGETTILKENLFTLLEKGFAVVVDLNKSSLPLLTHILGDDTENHQINLTHVAVYFNSGGNKSYVFEETLGIRQALLNSEPPIENDDHDAPICALISRIPLRRSILITASDSMDWFENLLLKSLNWITDLQFSVLWGGNYPSHTATWLEKLAKESGGIFHHLSLTQNNNHENFAVENYQNSTKHYKSLNLVNLSEEIKFPEVKETTIEGVQSISRVADQKPIQKAVIPLIVEVASGSSLEVRPGPPTQIQFTVKNNMNTVLQVFFKAKFNGVVQTVQPFQTYIPPSSTIPVTVLLQPIGPQTTNAVGTLTLEARAGNVITARSALISLTPQAITDNYAPKMSHRYDGDCSNYKDPQNCDQGQWSLEATIQDQDSGLLKVLSEPYGLLFQSQFVAGSKTPVTVYYTATCCQPNLIIWAEDLKGNYVKKSFDVFNQNLQAGEIASIVVGVLLVLFIIIAIIVAIILIKRRNRRNLVIPRSASR